MIDFLKKIFGDEALTLDQLSERLSADASIKLVNIADGSFVPKEELDKISGQLAEATAAAEKYADFDAQLQAAKDEGEQKLTAYKREVAISKALTDARVADEVSVRANLKLDDLRLADDGSAVGLSDQLTALKESKPFLFKQDQPKLELGGPTQGTTGGAVPKGIAGAVDEFYSK